MDRYRIMFTYRMRSVGFLCIHCFDTFEKQIVTVPIYSSYDGIDPAHGTFTKLPPELQNTLLSEKENINSGYYSIRTWDVENLG
ncbi:hypothetical protein [Guptibacillus algicola]|uniref:hypothetical protein n=1 Tax=Guptibacillus algicola TaxID=225844 RepID=UPI001CD6704E|nr:hypothetical protein [Alkalihalobacillus algicola]MCA0988351.1 hypothetical protein [Alkalihalobacillus algicola]